MFRASKTFLVIGFIAALSCLATTKSHGILDYDEDSYHSDVFERHTHMARNMPSDLAQNKITPPAEKDSQFWIKNAQRAVKQRAALRLKNKKAKNVIFFLGDGMSVGTLTAARILKGQRQGRTGEESVLTMEQFPFAGLSKVRRAGDV